MIKGWLQDLFVEAWKNYEETFKCSVTSVRDPNPHDVYRNYRPGCEWTNKTTGKKFVLSMEWKEINDDLERPE